MYIDYVRSPWNEKIETLQVAHGNFDLKISLWNSDSFLEGRIYRLMLYVCDEYDSDFQYTSANVPGTRGTRIRETHNQIWGIYVDSRVERKRIDNFFDRTLRRNLFVDSQKNIPWAISNLFFVKLWDKDKFTHTEIIEYAYHLDQLTERDSDSSHQAFEIEISRSLTNRSARKHIDNIKSAGLRRIADSILQFVSARCKGTLIESSYYGIYFMYDQEIFAEMATTRATSILLTLFDFQTNANTTYTLTETMTESDLNEKFNKIQMIYDNIANHSRLRDIKDPYSGPVD